jgi:hypothetical protein
MKFKLLDYHADDDMDFVSLEIYNRKTKEDEIVIWSSETIPKYKRFETTNPRIIKICKEISKLYRYGIIWKPLKDAK